MNNQKAGDNSQQIIVHNLNMGIDEKRAREIYDEKYSIAKKEFTEEALKIADARVREFENRLMSKMDALDDGLKAFADPGFQLLLVEAQKSAAATEREADYDLLSELLIHRIKKGNDRHIITGIHRAVEIVEEISDEALLGLTVIHAAQTLLPVAHDIKTALRRLDGLFEKIIYAELPSGYEWLDHLDILDTIRISSVGSWRRIDQMYAEGLGGIVVVGIKKESPEFYQAVNTLAATGIPAQLILEDNALLPDHVRLRIGNEAEVDSLQLHHVVTGHSIQFPLTPAQKEAIKSVLVLYSKDPGLQQEVQNAFMHEWSQYPHLTQLKDWWERLPFFVTITAVGKVLAHANAQRWDNSIPPLN